jgi:hypothetical protein
MKRLTILILLMGRLGFAQSNPRLELAIEAERVKALRGKPTIQIGLSASASGEVAGIKHSVLLDRLEQYLKDAGIPYNSAKNGIGLQDDTLMIAISVAKVPIAQPSLEAFSVRVYLLERAMSLRQPDYQKALPVWEADDFDLGSSGAAVETLMSLMQKFATDYLRANPDLQPVIRR